MNNSRHVERQIKGRPTSDGDGVKLTRVLTQDLQKRLDPFLMLDAFGSDVANDYIGGFPDHPHRGFETVTYMLAGKMRHKDSSGNEGLLENGGVQWMTAGKGVIHSEMPEQENGSMKGFQLWLNLPSQLKMCEPSYKDFIAKEIPQLQKKGLLIKVIAGEIDGLKGAIQKPFTRPQYYDLHFQKDNEGKVSFVHPLSEKTNAFVYVYEGSIKIGDEENLLTIDQGIMAILDNSGQCVRMTCEGNAKAILIAGEPTNEPIEQYGPFVMNTREEILKAIKEYQNGTFLNPQ